MDAFELAQRGTGLRMLLGRLRFLHRDAKWYTACKTVTSFCDLRVEEALERLKNGQERRTERDRLRLVDEAAKLTTDRYDLRSLILSVFSPAHDGAAVALSNVFFHLARHPQVWIKLREEVTGDAGEPITYESLNSYSYLKNVFRESRSPFDFGKQTLTRSSPSSNAYSQWESTHLSQGRTSV
jgi:cytochrome P450